MCVWGGLFCRYLGERVVVDVRVIGVHLPAPLIRPLLSCVGSGPRRLLRGFGTGFGEGGGNIGIDELILLLQGSRKVGFRPLLSTLLTRECDYSLTDLITIK